MAKPASMKLGDRVSRSGPHFIGKRFGSIAEVYRSRSSAVGQFHWMYAVRWDDTETVERGYLDFGGLTPVNPTVGGGAINIVPVGT